MMAEMDANAQPKKTQPPGERISARTPAHVACAIAACLFAVIYWRSCEELYRNWMFPDSYYSHGFLIPLISLYYAWKKRDTLAREPIAPSSLGLLVVAGSCLVLLAGDFLGFRLFAQLSIIPMLAGIIMVFFGKRHALHLWFPLVFLVFMIPIPPSLTQSIVLRTKLLATESAVQLAHALGYPMIRDGSFVIFGNDRLLVGEVCGGLRSLIALLAFGTLMSYVSKTRTWARFLILLISGPIAIISNMLRIFALCIIGYYWGSEVATGRVHDVSGIMIFAVAFALLFSVESILRKVAPASQPEEGRS